MTEEEWLALDVPFMMRHVAQTRPASARKLRLLAVAYARVLQGRPEYACSKPVAHLGEEVAEGRVALDELWDQRVRGWGYEGDWAIANMVLAPDTAVDMQFRKLVVFNFGDADAIDFDVEERNIIARGLILCILINPFRPVAFDLSWRTATTLGLAEAIYAERAFDRLPILADALEEAGCDHPDVLAHCRGDGPHARGCWVVDLLLGKA